MNTLPVEESLLDGQPLQPVHPLFEPRTKTSLSSNVNVYPNHSSNVMNVDVRSAETAAVQVRLINVLGQELRTASGNIADAGELNPSFDVSALPAGMYFVEINSNGSTTTKQVSITH